MKALRFIALGSLLAILALAQPTATAPQPTVQRDPQALSLLGQSLAIMMKNRTISDVKLQAQVTRTGGSETDTGSATLEAVCYDKSKLSIGFTSGPHAETRNCTAGVWSGAMRRTTPSRCTIPGPPRPGSRPPWSFNPGCRIRPSRSPTPVWKTAMERRFTTSTPRIASSATRRSPP